MTSNGRERAAHPDTVPPALWDELASTADATRASERRTVRYAGGAIVAAVALAGAAGWAGLFGPRLALGDSSSGGYSESARTSFDDVLVHNDGSIPLHIVDVTATLPGVELTRAASTPAEIGANTVGTIHLEWHIVDCGQAQAWVADPDSRAPLEVTSRMWWGGTMTTSLDIGFITALRAVAELNCPAP